MLEQFFHNRKIFLTGHTGFKGSWLCLLLHALGAKVTGFALDSPTEPSLYRLGRLDELINSITGDVRELESLELAMKNSVPEIVIHMAAQAIVRDSYEKPVDTFATNVMGTANLLEAVRRTPDIRAVVVVTTDKCYENREWIWGYRENESLGGHDPYSSSKAAAELVTDAYRRSFFNTTDSSSKEKEQHPFVATARSGNVIGGGDWAKDRLIPDCVQSLTTGEALLIRNPSAIRPWQHVLDSLAGYLMLAERLATEGSAFAEAWNFGPSDENTRPVRWIVESFADRFSEFQWEQDKSFQPHEAHLLRLDSSKARSRIKWKPQWTLDRALDETLTWYDAWRSGKNMREISFDQIASYEKELKGL